MAEQPFPDLKFHGSTTVGERGQVVLPASLRKKFTIRPGDKMLVVGNDKMGSIMLIKAEVLGGFLKELNKHITEMRGKILANGAKNKGAVKGQRR